LTFKHDIDYIIVINGFECTVNFPDIPNLRIIKRPNIGYDFGGHGEALKYLESEGKTYDYYFFMNSGVFGPIIERTEPHWTTVFINKITDLVKLVGTTIVCLPKKDKGGYGPKVEGFFFMTDQIGLDLLKREGTIFCNHTNKILAIINGEYGASRCILKHGYSIDCILQRYKNINWLDEANWKMNNNIHPSRRGSFYGKSIDPSEVIFHKWYWHGQLPVNLEFIKKYFSENI
jgi:hypothetical protein